MEFQVILSSYSKKDLKKIRKIKFYPNIRESLLQLKENPLSGDVKQLKNFPYSDYRKRVGNYRILYDINVSEKVVKVYKIIHRQSAYKF